MLVGFVPLSGQTWPQDPLKRVRLETWCRTHPKSTPETNIRPFSEHFSELTNSNFKPSHKSYPDKLPGRFTAAARKVMLDPASPGTRLRTLGRTRRSFDERLGRL